jgi:hypothetical protein
LVTALAFVNTEKSRIQAGIIAATFFITFYFSGLIFVDLSFKVSLDTNGCRVGLWGAEKLGPSAASA